MRSFLIFTSLLSLVFLLPLYQWISFAFDNTLYSHTILIPVISGYLIWIKREDLPAFSRGSIPIAILPTIIGLGMIVFYFLKTYSGWQPPANDRLCLLILAYLAFLTTGAILFLGNTFMRAILFPACFLVLMAPFPIGLENGIEQFFQRWSAEATEIFYRLTGITYLRSGQVFQIPGITIMVAQECSGVRSSLVLFITSLLASHLFLRSLWKKTAFTLLVIPLGIFRNAFRITTISLLCIHDDPKWIHSQLHHSGGPLFFVLSLIPFLLLLYYLRKSEGTNSNERPK